MKIFIDSADLEEIKQFYAWGIADGVTTNPSLIKKSVELRKKKGEKLNLVQYIIQILRLAKWTPVSLEVTETTAKGMIEQGKKLYTLLNPIAKNVVIKIPISSAFAATDKEQFAGITAIKALAKARIPVNCTLIFTPEQALLAAKAGARFVSPFAGRVDDFIRQKHNLAFEKTDYYPAQGRVLEQKMLHDEGIISGIDLVRQCVQILRRYNLKTEVLAASLRNPRQVREAALVGADCATLPFTVVQDMLKHEKTFAGMQQFIKDVVPEYAMLTKKMPK